MTRKSQLLVPRPARRRLSDVLRDIETGNGERVSVGSIVAALKERSFAPLMVIFAAPSVILFVPGASVFTGLPLIFLAIQLLQGRKDAWLPRFVAERSIEYSTSRRLLTVSLPYIERIERLAKPRFWPASELLAERVIGVSTLILATFLFLPIPFANHLPALTIIILALGLGERDGYWLAGGVFLTLCATVIVAGVVSVGALAIKQLLFG